VQRATCSLVAQSSTSRWLLGNWDLVARVISPPLSFVGWVARPRRFAACTSRSLLKKVADTLTGISRSGFRTLFVPFLLFLGETDKTTELVPGITLIALVSDAPGTKELKELSLAINTADGIVLVVGCSHPGIEGIVAEAAKINPHIHFIAGGFHLLAAQDPAIEKIAITLHDTYKVDYIAPGHCTGEPTFAALQRTFGDHYLYAGLGTTLDLGANPRTASDRRASGLPRERAAPNDRRPDSEDHARPPPPTAR